MSAETQYAKIRSKILLRKYESAASKIEAKQGWAKSLTDADLKAEFQRIKAAGRPLDEVVTGFALVRETARRVKGLEPYRVQLIGGLVLLNGKLAEMKTGEGKTLTLVAPASLLACFGKSVHVVTANAYLASRDAELMRPIYEALGLTVGVLAENQSVAEKQAAYASDVVYGVGSEFGFDYLKDNLVKHAGQRVQRERFAAIVDEVDSILIDEARVPMIISSSDADISDIIRKIDACASTLVAGSDYEINVKEGTASLTDAGYQKAELWFTAHGVVAPNSGLYATEHLFVVRRLHSAVKAYALFKKNRDYVVEAGELVLVDSSTGRKMAGRRLEDGLHEALEAKEKLAIQRGTLTRASVTYQSYFGNYQRLAGLTGTALTDAEEFAQIYNLETVCIPTNKPSRKQELDDLVFLTKAQKFKAAVETIERVQATGQPMLVGCATIRDADVLHSLLSQAGISHNTLTARDEAREAHIIANAGAKGAITVATHMAGRGTDINLGGERPSPEHFEGEDAYQQALTEWKTRHEEVTKLGGLFVLSLERNGIRRVDNQLSGRSARQGDPGTVQFLLSLEDELLEVFGQSSQLSLFRKALERTGSTLGGKFVQKLVVSAQQNFESKGFGARKALMQFDQTMADQRNAYYGLRNSLVDAESLDTYLVDIANAGVSHWCDECLSTLVELDAGALKTQFYEAFGLNLPFIKWVHKDELDSAELKSQVQAHVSNLLASAQWDDLSKDDILTLLDSAWANHLSTQAELQENVSLKGHTGFNQVFQFKKDAFELFKSFQFEYESQVGKLALSKDERKRIETSKAQRSEELQKYQRVMDALDARWVGRNESCPCGSGQRFKHCHGNLETLRVAA